jgi:predicted  nucleic acid-binding Zn-ribbon protein
MNDKIIVICQHCGERYELGKLGTVMGCDQCLGISRNPIDGTVLDETFGFSEADTDELTDMEKS